MGREVEVRVLGIAYVRHIRGSRGVLSEYRQSVHSLILPTLSDQHLTAVFQTLGSEQTSSVAPI